MKDRLQHSRRRSSPTAGMHALVEPVSLQVAGQQGDTVLWGLQDAGQQAAPACGGSATA